MDFELWNVVNNKYSLPKTEFSTRNEKSKKNANLNPKSMNALYCVLDKHEFTRVSTCKSANEMLYTLEVTREGTSHVKETKINLLVHKYKLFNMKPNESIIDMYTRLTDITNSLMSLGKEYS